MVSLGGMMGLPMGRVWPVGDGCWDEVSIEVMCFEGLLSGLASPALK